MKPCLMRLIGMGLLLYLSVSATAKEEEYLFLHTSEESGPNYVTPVFKLPIIVRGYQNQRIIETVWPFFADHIRENAKHTNFLEVRHSRREESRRKAKRKRRDYLKDKAHVVQIDWTPSEDVMALFASPYRWYGCTHLPQGAFSMFRGGSSHFSYYSSIWRDYLKTNYRSGSGRCRVLARTKERALAKIGQVASYKNMGFHGQATGWEPTPQDHRYGWKNTVSKWPLSCTGVIRLKGGRSARLTSKKYKCDNKKRFQVEDAWKTWLEQGARSQGGNSLDVSNIFCGFITENTGTFYERQIRDADYVLDGHMLCLTSTEIIAGSDEQVRRLRERAEHRQKAIVAANRAARQRQLEVHPADMIRDAILSSVVGSTPVLDAPRPTLAVQPRPRTPEAPRPVSRSQPRQELKRYMYCLADTTELDLSGPIVGDGVRHLDRKVITALFHAPNITNLHAAHLFEEAPTLLGGMTATPFINAVCYDNRYGGFDEGFERIKAVAKAHDAIDTQWAPPRSVR